VRVGVVFAGFLRVMLGVQVMAMRHMRVMPGLFMLRGAVVFRRQAMVFGRCLVMRGGFFVVFGQHACVHGEVSGLTGCPPAAR
jgi:hypothetical protein